MEYYTYILQSETSGMVYVGSTQDLAERLARHNTNRNKFTKGKGPWKLLFSQGFDSRSEAVQLEIMLKKMKSNERILRWITSQSG